MNREILISKTQTFRRKFATELESVMSGENAPMQDGLGNELQGQVVCLPSIDFSLQKIQISNYGLTSDFIVEGICSVVCGTPELEERQGEIDFYGTGTLTWERIVAESGDGLDLEEAAEDCFLGINLSKLRFNNIPSHRLPQAASVQPAKANEADSSSDTEQFSPVVELELIPEGEVATQRFAGKSIRKILHNHEWFFCITDVVAALTETNRAVAYWKDLKARIFREGGLPDLEGRIEKLRLPGPNGIPKMVETANTETLFRIIQSIPSAKAAPFKQWLAKVGYERIQERQNPSIAIKRAVIDYQLQGRSMEWIDVRLRTILTRRELTDEWQKRGVQANLEFAILTDEIFQKTFSKTTKEYKKYKSLNKQHSLRDHMDQTELILTLLGETATRQIAQAKNAIGFEQNKKAAHAGGSIAGNARNQLEQELGRSIVSSQNNLKKLEPSDSLLEFPPSYQDTIEKIALLPEPLKRKKHPRAS